MTYVKRRSTLVLFFLVLISVTFLSASIVMYQNSLTKLNDGLRDRKTQIMDLSKTVAKLDSNISKQTQIINLQIQREENLSAQFTNVKTEKEGLITDIDKLKEDLKDTEDELKTAIVDISMLKSELSDLNVSYNNLEDDLDDAVDDIKDICSEYNSTICEDYS